MNKNHSWSKKVLKVKQLLATQPERMILTLVFICGLGIAMYVLSAAFFIRPYNDDLNFAARDDFWESVGFWYNWSGRFTSLTIYIISGALDLPLLWLVPVVTFSLIGGGLSYLLTEVMNLRSERLKFQNLLCATLAVVFPVILFFVAPYSYTSMFWFAAAPLHSWAYGALLFFLGYIVRISSSNKRPSIARRIAEFSAVLVFAMLGEYATLLALGGLAAVAVMLRAGIVRFFRRSYHIFTALLIGLGSLLFAPGVIIRNQVLEATPRLPITDAITATLTHAQDFISAYSGHHKLLLLTFLVGVLIALVWRRQFAELSIKSAVSAIALLSLFVAAIVLSDVFLPLYAYRDASLLLYRAMLPASMALVISLVIVGLIVGRSLMRASYIRNSATFFTGLTLGFAACLALVSVPHYLRTVQDFKAFYAHRADVYDGRESYIKAQSDRKPPCTILVDDAPLDAPQENSDISLDPQGWQNQSLKGYLKSPCDLARKS